MKTKSILFALVMTTVSVAALAADPVGPRVVVINQKESGIFKVIYEGVKAGKVTLKIYNQNGSVLFSETLKNVDGFIRPVNFKAMDAGEYTIEVTDASGKQVQKIDYTIENKISSVHVAKIGGEDKYLLAVANENSEEINVRIFDGDNNLVHNESMVVNGNFGLVYNLKNVSGIPTFQITNEAGTKVIK
jgi:flagellar hook assembly protein FlgD